jgi:glycerol uptake facilitator-like aquaporin
MAILLPAFIMSAAPVSGGHLNPLMTMATFFCQLSTLPRTLVYLVSQTAGAAIGGILLRACLDTTSVGLCDFLFIVTPWFASLSSLFKTRQKMTPLF